MLCKGVSCTTQTPPFLLTSAVPYVYMIVHLAFDLMKGPHLSVTLLLESVCD